MQPGSHSGTPLVSPPQNPHATTMAATSAAPVPTATAAGTPGLAVPPSLSVAAAPPAPTAPPTSGLGPPSTSSSTHTPGAFVGPALEALEYAVKYGVPQPVAKDSSVQPVRAGSGGTKHSTKLCRYYGAQEAVCKNCKDFFFRMVKLFERRGVSFEKADTVLSKNREKLFRWLSCLAAGMEPTQVGMADAKTSYYKTPPGTPCAILLRMAGLRPRLQPEGQDTAKQSRPTRRRKYNKKSKAGGGGGGGGAAATDGGASHDQLHQAAAKGIAVTAAAAAAVARAAMQHMDGTEYVPRLVSTLGKIVGEEAALTPEEQQRMQQAAAKRAARLERRRKAQIARRKRQREKQQHDLQQKNPALYAQLQMELQQQEELREHEDGAVDDIHRVANASDGVTASISPAGLMQHAKHVNARLSGQPTSQLSEHHQSRAAARVASTLALGSQGSTSGGGATGGAAASNVRLRPSSSKPGWRTYSAALGATSGDAAACISLLAGVALADSEARAQEAARRRRRRRRTSSGGATTESGSLAETSSTCSYATQTSSQAGVDDSDGGSRARKRRRFAAPASASSGTGGGGASGGGGGGRGHRRSTGASGGDTTSDTDTSDEIKRLVPVVGGAEDMPLSFSQDSVGGLSTSGVGGSAQRQRQWPQQATRGARGGDAASVGSLVEPPPKMWLRRGTSGGSGSVVDDGSSNLRHRSASEANAERVVKLMRMPTQQRVKFGTLSVDPRVEVNRPGGTSPASASGSAASPHAANTGGAGTGARPGARAGAGAGNDGDRGMEDDGGHSVGSSAGGTPSSSSSSHRQQHHNTLSQSDSVASAGSSRPVEQLSSVKEVAKLFPKRAFDPWWLEDSGGRKQLRRTRASLRRQEFARPAAAAAAAHSRALA